MCAACVMAGHTKESYQAYYDKHSRNRPMPRKSTGGKRPRKQLRPHAVQRKSTGGKIPRKRFTHAMVAPPQRRPPPGN